MRAEEVENASDYPVVAEGQIQGSDWGRWPFACKVPTRLAQQSSLIIRQRQTEGQDEAVDNDLMKEQHKRMPINIDRQSRVTFGGTKNK